MYCKYGKLVRQKSNNVGDMAAFLKLRETTTDVRACQNLSETVNSTTQAKLN